MQVITLSTGVIALSATFAKDLKVGGTGKADRLFLYAAWILLIISLALGVLTLGAMAGTLDKLPGPGDEPLSIYHGSVKIFATLQFLSFLGGLALLILQAAKKLASV